MEHIFRLSNPALDSLQITVGANYYNDVVAPNLRGVARSIVGRYKPEEIYATKRDEIAAEIETALRIELVKKWVIAERVIIRDVTIPTRITAAINAKLEALQEAEKMEFILQKEKQEAERKRIEARGIADFQKIVSMGLTPEFLRWKGIEATEALATSPNAKTVVIGSGKDGLPRILVGSN
jgi:regulator of protease activity HflC (stomatin/prohibitin superfamily)